MLLPGYRPTPLTSADRLAKKVGVKSVWVKEESARLGLPAFKILGASWAVYRYFYERFGDEVQGAVTLRDLGERIRPHGRWRLVTATDVLFDGWVVDGNFLGAGRLYQVRFGTVSGERRAYFTETVRGTICELSVTNNELFIAPTNLLPPG